MEVLEKSDDKKIDSSCYSCSEVKPVDYFDIEYTIYSRIGRNGRYMGDVPLLCDECVRWIIEDHNGSINE